MGQCLGCRRKKSDTSHLCSHCPAIRPKETDESSGSDLLFRLTYNRERPTTTLQKAAFECSNCCLCLYIFCCPPCPPCIVEGLAFAPPKPTYDFVSFGPKRNGDYRMRLSSDAKQYSRVLYPVEVFDLMMRGFYTNTASRRRIACLYCRSSWFGPKGRKTLLLSHGNAEDLGLMVGRIAMICVRLDVDVFTYDYAGYGRSEGRSSERHLYEDVECVYEFVTQRMKIPWQQIVVVGTSLGSVPTIHLASRRSVRAVILQGSFASALRTVCPGRKDTNCLDRFKNLDKIEAVKSPTLFVHGALDKLFPLAHMWQLLNRCPGAKRIEPLVIKDGDHVDFDRHEQYWETLRRFVDWLEQPLQPGMGQGLVRK